VAAGLRRDERPTTGADVRWTPRRATAAGLVLASVLLLLLVGIAGPSAAKPPLGPGGPELPWAPGPWLVTVLLWTAYVLGALGVHLHLRWGLPTRGPWTWALALPAVAVATGWATAFGSADHTNYAAYGRIAVLGGDPYLTAPNAWPGHDPVIAAVRPPWDGTTSIYGPFATLLQQAASALGGANLRATVLWWQVVCLVAFAVVPMLLEQSGASRSRVLALWLANPLVLGLAVFGAHVDVVAAALVVLTLWAAPRSALVAGLFAGLAVSTKVTAAVVVLAVLVAWWVHERRGWGWRAARFVGGVLVTAVPLHWWAGPHVFDQLERARRSISLATPWRLVYQLLDGPLGGSAARTVVTVLSVAVALLLVVVLGRLTRGLAPAGVLGTATRWTFVLSTAYALSAAYSLPWYLLLTWATLPLLGASVLDRALLVHLLAATLAYVPGRVEGMTATVQRVTLWVRRVPVPYAVLLVWVWLTRAAWSGSSRSLAPRPPASVPPPR
jgi:hypothetical protein